MRQRVLLLTLVDFASVDSKVRQVGFPDHCPPRFQHQNVRNARKIETGGADNLNQVPLLEAALTGGLSLDRLQQQREARMGVLKEKAQGCGGWQDKVGVSLLFFWIVASGCVSQDYGLGKGPGCSQVQEGQSDHQPLRLASDVYCAR